MANHSRAFRPAALAIATTGLILLAACGGSEKPAEKADAGAGSAQTITAATVSLTNLPLVITASGSVSAWEEVPVGAETGGLTATAVYVDEGRYVRQGQPLVQMNTSLLAAQVRQAQAQAQTAEANAARDDAALARAQDLKERGFLSQAGLDTALANQRASQAGVSSAQAALSQARTQLNQATIRAPVSGLITSRSVTRGQIIQPGVELFRIVRDGRLELDAQVPEAELRLVRSGMGVTVISDQTGESRGNVRLVTPQVDPQTRLGIARVSLASGSGLRPGMFARANIDAGNQPALTIPASAIVYRDGKSGVYRINPDNTVTFVEVRSGARSGDSIAVTQGLTEGQRVAVQGAGFLSNGDRVRIGEATAAPQPGAGAIAPASGAAAASAGH